MSDVVLQSSDFSVDAVCLLLEQLGYQASLNIEHGQPLVRSGMQGVKFAVAFLGTAEDRAYGLILFVTYSDFAVNPFDSNASNTMLAASIFYVKDDGSAGLRLNIPLLNKQISRDIFMAYFAAWMIDINKSAGLPRS